MASWVDAVTKAIRRHVAATGSTQFTRQAFIDAELSAIVGETETTGLTPAQTLGRELQQLRDAGLVAFEAPGIYRWLGDEADANSLVPSRAVFVMPLRADRHALPERRFVMGRPWLRLAQRTAGQWVLYQGRDGYGAAARVDRVSPDEAGDDHVSAWIEQGSYLEFGRTVPLEIREQALEHGAATRGGGFDRRRSASPIRLIADVDFNRILDFALSADEDVLARDAADDVPADTVQEERSAWGGSFDRATMLVERKVRDRQFRRRVLNAYGASCALTGIKLINGGGRAETQAAHIKSVAAGGPDSINNGIALSGTMHWMFDRGLISLSDSGEILLSRAINDRDRVERLINPDRQAQFPAAFAHRPHPDYLKWHRTECFHH